MSTEAATVEHLFKVCNLTYLKNFAGGDQEFIRQMIELFFTQVPEELNHIKQQATLNNLSDVKNIAHKLKSSVSLLGAESMVRHLKQIEDLAAYASDGAAIRIHYDELLNLNVEAVKELKVYLEGVDI